MENPTDISRKMPMWMAAWNNDVEKMKRLLEEGEAIDQRDEHERSPIYIAARMGNSEAVQWLIDAGADVNDSTWNNRNAVFAAAWSRDQATVDVLLKAGANPWQHDNLAWCAVTVAKENGDAAMETKLREAGKPFYVSFFQ